MYEIQTVNQKTENKKMESKNLEEIVDLGS